MTKRVTSTVDYAIDLGTSDSVIAYKRDDEVCIIENYQTGDIFTPSAVWIDEKGRIRVGSYARDALITDSQNAYTEFKLNMGFPVKYHFKRSNKDMLPEQLSAQILKNLKESIIAKTGEKIEEVIITIPANSNPLNIKATSKAARLAGFRKAHFILEPVAAALAYGFDAIEDESIWMIYDLGGGTFDTCLVRINGKKIERLADSGIDNIGGVMFDWMIVDKVFKKKVLAECPVDDFTRNNPGYKQEFYKLKKAAEKSKKTLSYQDEVDVKIDNLFDGYDFEYTLTRKELEDIIRPFINTTINTCNDLLWQLSLKGEDIEKIILVGGATLTPLITQSLKNEYNTRIEKSIDPLTVVARGAAIYASGIQKSLHKPSGGQLAMIINSQVEVDDDNLQVNGRIFSRDSNISYSHLQLKVYDDDSSIATKYLKADGTFQVLIPLIDEKVQYHVGILDANGEKIQLDPRSPNTIQYQKSIKTTHSIQNTIQILLRDNNTLTLAKKGDLVDKTDKDIIYTTQKTLYTTRKLCKDDKNTLKIPVYSGENIRAENNTRIGQIEIDSLDITEDLPVNSKIKLIMQVDKEDKIHFTIGLPQTKSTLEKSFKYQEEIQSLEVLEENHEKLIKRVNYYAEFNDPLVKDELGKIRDTGKLEYLELLMNITRQDENCIKSTQDYINSINNRIDNLEEKLKIRIMQNQIEKKLDKLEYMSRQSDNINEEDVEKIITQYNIIIENNTLEMDVYEKLYHQIVELYTNTNMMGVIKSIISHMEYELKDEEDEGITQLIKKTHEAIKADDRQVLLKNILELYTYYKCNENTNDSDVIIY